jgi:hypothetical protein
MPILFIKLKEDETNTSAIIRKLKGLSEHLKLGNCYPGPITKGSDFHILKDTDTNEEFE